MTSTHPPRPAATASAPGGIRRVAAASATDLAAPADTLGAAFADTSAPLRAANAAAPSAGLAAGQHR